MTLLIDGLTQQTQRLTLLSCDIEDLIGSRVVLSYTAIEPTCS